MCAEQDQGDEHVDVPPPPLDEMTRLLIEWSDPPTVSYEVMQFIMLAEAYRDCCRACALEVNGEDGS
jgi:hypothetical protein